MKRLLKAAAALVCAFGFTLAHAQLTTITASTISMGGVPIAAGTVTATPVNSSGIAIPFATGGGGLNAPTAFSGTITAGAIDAGFQVPDACLTSPANILYTVQITNTATQKSFTLQQVPNVCGTTWALDHYGPPSPTTNVQAVQVAYGTAAPPASCVSPSFYVRNYSGGQLWVCVAGAFVQITGSGGSSYTFSNGLSNTSGTVSPTYGTTANTITQGNDSRFATNQAAIAAEATTARNASNLTSGQVAPGLLPVSGAFNCFFFGDSNTAAIGVANQANAMTYLVTADTGCTPAFIGGYSGSYAEYIAAQLLANYQIPPATGVNSAYRQPLVVLGAGTNNGYYCINTSGPTSACETNYTEAMSAMEAWVTLPTASKLIASTATPTGTWAADGAAPLNSTVSGTVEKSTTNGSTLTFTVANSGPKIGVTRIARDANLGTFTVAIDAVLQTSACTGTTTFQNYGCSTATLNNAGNETAAPLREEFSVTPGVSHTVVITVTSPTLSTNVVSILDVDTTPVAGTTVGPVVMVSGVPKSANDSMTPTALAAIDTTDAAQVTTGKADGMNLTFVNVRTPITFANGVTSPAINSGADMETNNTTLCPTNGANGLHMNLCGEFHWAQSIEATALGNGVGFAYVSQAKAASFSSQGYSSIASIWYHNVPIGNSTEVFSTTKAMASGDNYFGVNGDGFLSQVGQEYDPAHSKYATTTNYGLSTEVTFKTCPTGYTLVSQCTLRAWLDASGYFYAQSYGQAVGTALASATTIAPVAGITHVTGTVAIATITPPSGYSSTIGGCITLIADGAWTTTTAGNIFATMTAVAGTPYKACYDGSKWYIN